MNLNDLLRSNDDVIKNAAQVVRELTEALNDRRVSLEQYTEMVNDLLDLQRIDKLSASIERKAAIEEAFNFLKESIVDVVSIFPIK